jgi:hypothetical protein
VPNDGGAAEALTEGIKPDWWAKNGGPAHAKAGSPGALRFGVLSSVCGHWPADQLGGAVSLQATHGSKSSLQASVVSLDGGVGMDLRVMEGGREQLVKYSDVDAVPVGGDLYG